MSDSRLSTRYATAFVTGASSGLGLAFTKLLLSEGVRVWGSSRDLAKLKGLISHEGFTAVELDLADPEKAVRVFNSARLTAGGDFDLVVQNAGYGVFAPFESLDFSVWQRQLTAMILGTAQLSHAAYVAMQKRGNGCLVHVSSLATEFPIPYMSAYNMAKAALSALSESLMAEARGTGVCVIDFRPGDYQTDFNAHVQSQQAIEGGARTAKVWSRLEQNLHEAPLPEKAAIDLKRALWACKSGTVRSGGFFQAFLAPLISRLSAASWRRAVMARYFNME